MSTLSLDLRWWGGGHGSLRENGHGNIPFLVLLVVACRRSSALVDPCVIIQHR